MHRRSALALVSVGALAACTGTTSHDPEPVYSAWLHDDYYWYDDDFWLWLDEDDDCCVDPDDLRDALREWWNGLTPEQQDQMRERVDGWLEDNDLHPATDQERRQLIEVTVEERWTALTPKERRSWLKGRSERAKARLADRSGVDPATIDQAALRARTEGWRQDLPADRRAELAANRPATAAIGSHPVPSGFPSARQVTFRRPSRAGGGRGRRGGGGRRR